MAACWTMFNALAFRRRAKLAILLSWAIIGLFMFQGMVLATHQGKHAAQSIQREEAGRPTLDDGPCGPCTALHISSESPSFAMALSDFLPWVSFVILQKPVDPKRNILRTCDARGPPSFFLI